MLSDKLIKEALLRIGYDKKDYLKISTEFNPNLFIYYMELAFATGFDLGGLEERQKHSNNMNKPVAMMNKPEGEHIRIFSSCKEAGTFLDRKSHSVSTAAKKNGKCAGFYLKFI